MAAMRQRFSAFRRRFLHPAPRRRPPPSEEPGGPRRAALIVGLGNPGAGYGDTRHNVGARCVALLARRHGVQLQRHGSVDHATVELERRALHLLRPRAMVNVSGPLVAGEMRRLRLRAEQLLVIYDDLDLPVGQVRIRPQGGHGGHNGVRSLVAALDGGEFARVRIGIDRPYDDGQPVRDPDRIADWVLSAPGAEQRRLINAAIATAADAIELAASDGVDRAMSAFNPARE